MKLRAFAAAWTVFTMLAAPALLAADEVPPPQPAQPAPGVPPVPPPAAEVETPPAPAPAAPAVEPAPEPPPAEEQAVAEEPAPEPVEEPAGEPEKRKERRPKARAAASTTVTITDFEFAPASVTVNVGDTVTWVNNGPTVHTATGDGFDTGNLSKGQSGSHTFTSAGTFSYICTPHPFMKASVTVTGGSSGGENGSDAGQSDPVATADDGPTLPNSGSDAWALTLIGTGLLSLGLAVRRRTEAG